jgi:hypothetical protein
MNNQIKELALQAGFFPEPNWDHTGWHAAGHNDTFEKFAELIIRKCANIVFDHWCDGTNEDSAEMSILKHFGVEE